MKHKREQQQNKAQNSQEHAPMKFNGRLPDNQIRRLRLKFNDAMHENVKQKFEQSNILDRWK